MALRFKRYQHRVGGTREFYAVQITEQNIPEIVAAICKAGGAATGHYSIPPVKVGKKTKKGRPGRIRLKQRNYGYNWGKVDWRVANIGDWIVRHNFKAGELSREHASVEFERVKDVDFKVMAQPYKK